MNNPYGISSEDEAEFEAEAERLIQEFFELTSVMLLAHQADTRGDHAEARKLIHAANVGINRMSFEDLKRTVAVAANLCAVKALDDAAAAALVADAEAFLNGQERS